MIAVTHLYSNKVGQSVLSVFFLFVLCSSYRDSMAFKTPPLSQKIWVKLVRIPVHNVYSFLSNCTMQMNNHNPNTKATLFDCRECGFKVYLKKQWNNMMKQVNGNILRIVHINKGKSFLSRETSVQKTSQTPQCLISLA